MGAGEGAWGGRFILLDESCTIQGCTDVLVQLWDSSLPETSLHIVRFEFNDPVLLRDVSWQDCSHSLTRKSVQP